MQLRMNDIKVRDTPRFLIDPSNREDHHHAIVIPMPEQDDYVIPLLGATRYHILFPQQETNPQQIHSAGHHRGGFCIFECEVITQCS